MIIVFRGKVKVNVYQGESRGAEMSFISASDGVSGSEEASGCVMGSGG